MIAMGIAVIAVVRAIRSPVSEAPTYRALFVLVVIGVVLISVLPEATFIIPAIDVVGLDLVTILVTLELSHYLIRAGRMFRASSASNEATGTLDEPSSIQVHPARKTDLVIRD